MSPREVFLVTGASKGLGKSICKTLAQEGYTVIGLARSSTELTNLGNYLNGLNNGSQTIACDLSDLEQVKLAGADIIQRHPRIHGVIHNAGIIGPVGRMFSVSDDAWNETMTVNLLSAQLLTRILYPAMVEASRCRVTTISSGAAVNSLVSWSAYCSSKAALDMWTRCLADEGADDHVSAISIAPGIVDTNMQATIRSATKDDFPMVDRFIEFHQNGDLVSPDDVAHALFNLMTTHTMEQSGLRFDVRDL
ncbi:MAG: SDR family NAD(P)-dependent oxidoreductase [Candidatus Thermoplasmatota archaeon]|nr:SDR family NAD(P)-dependent oxidoreductase [Candidatus Thermoplasmatota archaeon]